MLLLLFIILRGGGLFGAPIIIQRSARRRMRRLKRLFWIVGLWRHTHFSMTLNKMRRLKHKAIVRMSRGNFFVDEEPMAGFNPPSFSGDCSAVAGHPFIADGTISSGQHLTCTITNVRTT
jgi:hypothetical protein